VYLYYCTSPGSGCSQTGSVLMTTGNAYFVGWSVAVSLVGSSVLVSAGAVDYDTYGGFGFVACTSATSCSNTVNYYHPSSYFWAGWSIAMAPGGSLVALGDKGESGSSGGWVSLWACTTSSTCTQAGSTITSPNDNCTFLFVFLHGNYV
jgi:hypothetical protein